MLKICYTCNLGSKKIKARYLCEKHKPKIELLKELNK